MADPTPDAAHGLDMTVFTGARSAAGYRLNKLAVSLSDPANREAFLADEHAYGERYGLSDDEQALVAARDWGGMIATGGNIYVLVRLAATVGSNLIEVGASMRGQSADEFLAWRHSATEER